ncbi:filamentous hemagglutinin N-terminal domain-containing protein [Variovorax gossypii]|uniref:two-partner secretion domain-containing protein n=1 Tax=Variovorax gossypii TaxID=1679495 RepID=UPI0023EA5B30|nr:filamentous hemagglutinin N-terminal domain-containing protein [Variovorax gossypii]
MHRVVFNAARGMRMAVQETAASTGKGASKATSAGVSVAIAGALMAMSTQAQIVGAPNVSGNLRPTVLVAPNGVPLVNIQTPSAAGVSRNVYNQFNVGANGAILNNSRVNVQTQLGGFVQGNPSLATGPARIILNEVNGGTPSQLRGYIEVGGQRAEVIIANPAGISVDGGGFINASRATLTTGTPQFNAVGGLDSFLVRGGTVTIDGAGLDASKTDYAAILARAVQANASIWASELKVVTGANQISADHGQITPTAGTGAAPTFALDVAALGGMYANKIVLIGSEAGLGVRNAGSIGAGAGGLVVTAAGRLENIGTLEGQRVELTTPGDISNRGGTIRQGSSAGLTIASPVLSNTNGGVIGAEPVSASASGGGAATPGTPTPSGGGGSATPSTTAAGGTSTGGASTPTTYTPPMPGVITAGGTISNDGGRIYAGGPITLNTPQINNAGGSLNVATMAVSGPNFSNAGGTLNVSNSFSASVGQLDNTGGKLNVGSLNIAASGDLINADGVLSSATDANLTVGGKIENTRGSISVAGALTANVAGATISNSGTLAANQALTLNTSSLENAGGSIQSAQGGVQLGVTNALTNGTGGSINAATDLGIQAGSLANGGSLRSGNDANIAVGGALTNDGSVTAGRNTTITAGSVQSATASVLGAGIQSDGKLGGAGDLRVTTTGALVTNGTNLAGGNATLQGTSVDLSTSQTSAANIAVTATQSNVITSKATVVTPGTLAITANSNAAQTLVNDAGQLNAGQLQINVSNLANTNNAEIVQTGTGTTTIATSGTLNNDGSRIASNGQDLTLQATAITSNGGKIEHAGTGTLAIAGGSFNGANGQITTNNALVVAMSGTFNQDGDKAAASAKQITIDAGSLSSRGGRIVQTEADATRITIVGALDNSNAGVIASNGNTTIAAGSLSNQSGSIRAAETSSLALNVGGLLDNSNKGVIGAGGNTSVTAGSLNNNAGSVTAVGDLSATIAGAATNVGGTLAANGNTTVSAASLDNSKGTTGAVNGNLGVTTSGQTINNGGTLQAGGVTTLSNGGLVNQGGKVFGNSLSIDTHKNALDNSASGTIAATTTVAISSGALSNDAGLVQSGGAMIINTNGQSLSNTNAAGYSSKQGGITSADALDLKTGAINNSAGFIGSKNALTADIQKFSNAAGGQVIGQSAVAINTNGASYDNSGGKTQAVGNLSINAGDIQNVGGLMRSLATTSLNADSIVNTNTLGTDQGIDGKSVAIGTGNLNNDAGAIRADVNATVTSGGTVTNTSNGLISAGDTLSIVDPNRANPAAKSLSVVNTGGNLISGTAAVLGADGKVQTAAFGKLAIDASGFSGDGSTVGVNDLSIALTQDVTNNVEVKAGRNLTYATTGKLTNNGKLLAGGTATASGTDVENTANAEITGKTTIVNAAGTLTNRGLIDGVDTQLNGGTVNNLGTGRIYGDAISVAAGTLNNDSETVNGATKAGTIASRGDLDIGAQNIMNREHALLFSAGDMFIGGGLDANRYATGKGATLNNLSATIESLGDMNIAMGSINNFDNHFAVVRTSSGPVNDKYTITPLGGIEMPYDQFVLDRGNRVWSTIVNGQVLTGKGWIERQYTTTTEIDQPANPPDPGRIYSGGNMTIDGKLHNRDSQVMAGGTFTIDPANVDNTPTQGQRIVTVSGLQAYAPPQPGSQVIGSFIPEQKSIYTIDVGTSCINTCTDVTPSGTKISGAQGVSVSDRAGAAGSVTAGTRARAIVEVPSAVGGVIKTGGNSANGAGGADGASGTGGTATIPLVVRTSLPNTTIPTASLFNIRGGGGYLIETDPRFASYRNWLSSDYLLNNLGLDPNNILKRLGDGFYEQKLIREQVAQLTGYRFLDGYYSDEEQYAALMNAGATFAKEYGLRPGIALTPAQMAQLTSDIVWLVEQTVTLPDGTTQQVLVPQVYVRVQPGDITGSGSVLSADRMIIKGAPGAGDLTNSGTIAGRTLVDIKADNINNLGGRIAGGSVALDARNDINNIGGLITGANSVSLKAGNNINIETTTKTQNGWFANNTNIDRVAGVYVTNPGGTLIASAGNDVNVIGGILSNKGANSFTSVTAGKNINLATVTESSSRLSVINAHTYTGDAVSKETGSTISGNGTVLLNAKGGDINARAATVDAGSGLLSLTAANDINITSGVDARASIGGGQSTNKSFLKSTTTTFTGEASASASIGSSFTGGVVSMDAANNLNIEGARIAGRDGVALHGGNSVNIYEARNTVSVSSGLEKKTSGLNFNPTLGAVIGPRGSGNTLEIKTDTAAPTTISSQNGGVLIEGGVVNMRGVQVDAAKDIKIEGTDVNIAAAENRLNVNSSESSRGGTFNAVGFHSFGKGINAKLTDKMESSATSLTDTTLNGANVSIAAIGTPGSAGGTLNLAGTTVNTPGTLTLKGDQVNLLPQLTETSVRNTSQGGDVAWQKTTDKGNTDQKLNYNQLNFGKLVIDANHVQVGLNAKDSVEALGKQPGMDWVNQLQNDPKIKDKVDWAKVEEAHKNWDYRQQGLTPAAAAVITVVVAYFTAGAASGAGEAAGSSLGGLETITLADGAAFTGGLTTTGTIISGAVTAGVTALASQATVALINNQGDIGRALHDLGSNANVRSLLTAIVTGGALAGLNMNPTGLPTAGGGSQEFLTQLGQNLQAGAARAVIGTAINGGSLEKNLKDALKTSILDTVAAQAANAIGNWKDAGKLDEFTNKVAHAIAGCMVGAARTGDAGGCGAGALGAAVGEMAAEVYGRQADTVQFAAMISAMAAAITGADAAQINLASAAGGNAAANNYLNHPDAVKLRELTAACKTNCTPSQREQLADLLMKDTASTAALNSCGNSQTAYCQAVRADFSSAVASFLPNDDDIWNWARKQESASGGRYSAAQIYDAYRTSFIPGAVPNMSVEDLTDVAAWMRGRIVGDGSAKNPGEEPLSVIAMGWAMGNSASAQGALMSVTAAVAGVIRSGMRTAGLTFSNVGGATSVEPVKPLDFKSDRAYGSFTYQDANGNPIPVAGGAPFTMRWPVTNVKDVPSFVQSGEYTCGAACAARMAQAMGYTTVTEQTMINGLGIGTTTPDAIARELRAITGKPIQGGVLDVKVAEMTDPQIRGLVNQLSGKGDSPYLSLFGSSPTMGMKNGHWVIVEGLDSAGNIKILDPVGKSYTMTPSSFRSAWEGGAIVK